MTKERNQKIVSLWRTKKVTMQDIATKYKMSRERVRQILAKARQLDASIPTHSQIKG